MDKKSVVFDYIDDYDSLKQVLEIFESDPLYYVMLVLEDNEGNSPLKLAIENNSPRIIELILNCLLKLGHFNLSRKMFIHFSTLFKLELRAFEKYLNTCYFVTEQMKAINKIKMPETSFFSEMFKSGKTAFEENIIEHYTCSILDKEFYKKYEVPDKDGNPVVKDDSKIKSNAIAPADRPASAEKEEDKENVNLFEDEEKLLNRVSIKGIEFDWIFHGDQAKQFLKDLSNAKNINIFGQDIIRDIVLFQWKYFKKVIIWRLFVPYIIYFLLFCVYTTWLLERQYVEDEDAGPYDIASYVVGSVILLFN